MIFFTVFIAGLISNYNYGGGSANFEVGAIPFLIILIPYFVKNKKELGKYSNKPYKIIMFISLGFLFFYTAFLARTIIPINTQRNYYNIESSILPDFIDLYDRKETILVDGDSAIFSDEAGYINQLSLTHMTHIGDGNLKKLNNGNPLSFYSKNKYIPYILKGSFKKFIREYSNRLGWLNDLNLKEEKCFKHFCTGFVKVN